MGVVARGTRREERHDDSEVIVLRSQTKWISKGFDEDTESLEGDIE
jgi:hypothetical protein